LEGCAKKGKLQEGISVPFSKKEDEPVSYHYAEKRDDSRSPEGNYLMVDQISEEKKDDIFR
jgi:hypothetical protein